MVSVTVAKRMRDSLGLNPEVMPAALMKYALEVELEHGSRYGEATNVTGDDLAKTAQIVLAHLQEFPDYYQRLREMERQAERQWEGRKKPRLFRRR